MGATSESARKVRDKLLAQDPNYYKNRAKRLLEKDPNFYSRIGARGKKGGKLSSGSFTSETAREAGKKSKRGKAKTDMGIAS